ncbi:MAG: MFS transporter, partial [Candidatus Promineifilaceae bacterium]
MSSNGHAPTPYHTQSRQILFALVFPTMAIILNGSMFGVALPTIRSEFAMEPDVTAWLAIAFSLPFMMFMPLYGRLGDELGKARLLTLGVIIFFAGTALIWLSNSLASIFIGRIIQGAGSAGITPLSLAIISQRFSADQRGNALGLWNATAPFTSIFAPAIGGYLTDNFGWRSFLIPTLIVSIAALLIVRMRVPSLRSKPNWQILRRFDWVGVLLFSSTIINLVL